MKKYLSVIVLLTISIMLFNSCKDKDEDTTDELKDNYRIVIYNNIDNGIQFTYLTLRALESGVSNVSKVIVSNPGQYTSVYVTVPKATSYKINIYTQKDQTSVWWNSIMLDPTGEGVVYLEKDVNDSFLGSSFNNVYANETDIP